jgi:ammonium transporter, Amt family
MYGDGTGIIPGFGMLGAADNAVADVVAGGEDAPYYSNLADFFFQVVFVATAMSIVSGAVAERMKLWSFLAFAVVMTAVIYPVQGYWTWGGGFLDELGYSDYAGSGIVHMAGAAAALAGVILLGARKGKYGAGGAGARHPRRQPAIGDARHFDPVDGLVRLQWRLGAEGLRRRVGEQRRAGVHQHQPGGRGGLVAALVLAKALVRQGRPDDGAERRARRAGVHHRRSAVADAAAGNHASASSAACWWWARSCCSTASSASTTRSARSRCTARPASGACLRCCCPTGGDGLGQLIGLVVIFAWVFLASLLVWFVLKKTRRRPRVRAGGVRGRRPARVRPRGLPGVHQGRRLTRTSHGAGCAGPAGGGFPPPAFVSSLHRLRGALDCLRRWAMLDSIRAARHSGEPQ